MIKIQENKKCLIIADVHQNISYVKRCLDKEPEFDYVVFLGDYFDTFYCPDNITFFTVANTSKWLSDLNKELGEKVIWLSGNHDIAYLSTFSKFKCPSKNTFYYCSGYTRNKANEFNKYADIEWVNNWKLGVKIGKFHLSHAGWNYNFMKPFMTIDESIEFWIDTWEDDKYIFKSHPNHWIWDTSPIRGGFHDHSSPVWMDWQEFVPIAGCNQIVGHTNSLTIQYRNKEDVDSSNYCIDCDQQIYAILHNNKLDIKNV